jgi:Acyl-CoA dehydrogenase, C-terminal domain
VQACMAKVFATETALRITDEAIQILGGYGYMGDYKVEQNYRDARLLTIGEGATEILRFAIAGNLWDAKRDGEDVLPSHESLNELAGPQLNSDGEWAPGWHALQLAAGSVDIARRQVERQGRPSTFDPGWQCQAAAFAGLATRLWVSVQAALAGMEAAGNGAAAQRRSNAAQTFVVNSSIEICHESSKFLGTLGQTDAQLLSNYAEALQIPRASAFLPSRR